ncbi:hypothetical protein [Streptomyces sp. NPDC093094]|uniref:hypothetical protein n=1 Tax=Streptomyces sp. NPDC093094 TaxID=3366026 RepID=UPI0037F4E494
MGNGRRAAVAQVEGVAVDQELAGPRDLRGTARGRRPQEGTRHDVRAVEHGDAALR